MHMGLDDCVRVDGRVEAENWHRYTSFERRRALPGTGTRRDSLYTAVTDRLDPPSSTTTWIRGEPSTTISVHTNGNAASHFAAIIRRYLGGRDSCGFNDSRIGYRAAMSLLKQRLLEDGGAIFREIMLEETLAAPFATVMDFTTSGLDFFSYPEGTEYTGRRD